MRLSLRDLRRYAIASSLFTETTLGRAINRMGFVQADPIRSPARAQDLILRHRVRDYRIGDLEQNFRKLKLEEDYLYAYGFMPKSTWQLLHPRPAGQLSNTDDKVLEIVSRLKRLHPRDLRTQLGNDREMNAWGGYSKSTTRSLERLHYRGLIRVAGREGGMKLYQRAGAMHEPREHDDRLRLLILLIAKMLAPISERSLRATLRHLGRAAPNLSGRTGALAALIRSGELDSAEVEGLRYVWPAGKLLRREPEEAVRFLAPFDPLVWDRRRFEHFWGWPYRFEAYTPAPKRTMGYYALPLLWREEVIGWVNVSGRDKDCEAVPGYVSGAAPSESSYRRAYRAEAERLKLFMAGLRPLTRLPS